MLVRIVYLGEWIRDHSPRLTLAYFTLVGFLFPPSKSWKLERRPIVTHDHYSWCGDECPYRYTGEYLSPASGEIHMRHARTKFGAVIARQVARGAALVYADV